MLGPHNFTLFRCSHIACTGKLSAIHKKYCICFSRVVCLIKLRTSRKIMQLCSHINTCFVISRAQTFQCMLFCVSRVILWSQIHEHAARTWPLNIFCDIFVCNNLFLNRTWKHVVPFFFDIFSAKIMLTLSNTFLLWIMMCLFMSQGTLYRLCARAPFISPHQDAPSVILTA